MSSRATQKNGRQFAEMEYSLVVLIGPLCGFHMASTMRGDSRHEVTVNRVQSRQCHCLRQALYADDVGNCHSGYAQGAEGRLTRFSH